MKHSLSVVLILALISSTVPTHAHAQSAPDRSSWSRVAKLRAGLPLVVAARGELELPEGSQYFLGATDDRISLLEPDQPSLPRNARRFLIALATRRPEVLIAPDGEYVEDDFRVSRMTLFYRGAQVAELGVIVKTIAKDDIVEIARPPRRASPSAVVGGVGAGILGGIVMAPVFIFSPCHGSCAPNEVMLVLTLIGLPIAGGFLAARATRHQTETIYHV